MSPSEVRAWYHKEVAKIRDVVERMRKEGKSSEEIFEEAYRLRTEAKLKARELMDD
jgi:hypothetical protein